MPRLAPSSLPEVDVSAPTDVLPRWLDAMRRGEFEAAWQQTDRIEHPRRIAEKSGAFRRQDHHLVWDGQDFAGRTVLVRCEHGLGDAIQFLRYLPRLRKSADHVILKAQPALLDLLADIPGADLVINAWTDAPDPPHDVQIECMEFPYAFRDGIHSIPMEVPYFPTERILQQSGICIPSSQNRQVGLVWAASSWDDSRSVSLHSLAPLAHASGVTFYSLQQGDPRTAASDAPFPVIELSEKTVNIMDAAAAMLQLDLIITVDNMVAHLAGALGRPVWVLLKHDADWRWMHDRSDSPWYPTMRLFRQKEPDKWSDVITELASALTFSDHPVAN